MFINPRFYEQLTGYRRSRPYHLLRIGHYSKEEYKIKKHRTTKVWHTFRFLHDFKIIINADGRVMSMDELFDEEHYIDKQSVTLKLTPKNAEFIKKYGWQYLTLVNEQAHWLNKTGPKKCPKCERVVEELKKCFIHFGEMDEYQPYWKRYVWLCNSCAIDKETKRLIKQKQKQSAVISPPLLPS